MIDYQPEPDEPQTGIRLWELCFAGFMIGVMAVAAWKIWAGV